MKYPVLIHKEENSDAPHDSDSDIEKPDFEKKDSDAEEKESSKKNEKSPNQNSEFSEVVENDLLLQRSIDIIRAYKIMQTTLATK